MHEDAVIERAKRAFHADDAPGLRALLAAEPGLKALINASIGPFDSPAVCGARSREMLDVLIEAGADINAKSSWWAGGFGLLHNASPELARYAILRGAIVAIHAAARLGMIERVRELVAGDAALLHARGGDGQTPLHFASTVEIAEFLLERGAAIDALDVDHESSPAQYMVRERQDVARFLVSRGCKADLLMAAALGDVGLVRRLLAADAGAADAGAIRMRVSPEWFPMGNPRAGGTIYQWTLGWHVSAHQVARAFGHGEVFEILMAASPDEVKLITACWLGEEEMARGLLAATPGLVGRFTEEDRRQLAHAARNNDLAAVRAMVGIGMAVDVVGQHGATPLHWAAFHGNAAMVEVILRAGPALEATDRDYQGTPVGWAMHGSENGWHCETGDYGALVAALLRAGAKRPAEVGGSEAVRRVLMGAGE